MKYVSRKILALSLLGLFFLMIAIAFCTLNARPLSAYAKAQINDCAFEGDSVLVLTDGDYDSLVGNHLNIFGDLEISAITNLSNCLNSTILKLQFNFNNKEKVLQVIDELKYNKYVSEVTPNYVSDFGSANDTYYNLQWGLGTYGIKINNAWEVNEGSKEVRVGIIDTGVSAHEDLNANLVTGWNFADNNSNTEDLVGHGTHVAGIVGAVGDNGIGVVGVNKSVSLVPLKISNTNSLTDELLIKAINYAQGLWGTSTQIDILNFSGWNFPNSSILSKAINDYSGLFVCIAGNGYSNIDSKPNYPGSYSKDNLITVGAIDSNGNKSNFSNYGKTSVDIFAPGGNILSTYPAALCESGTCDRSNHYANGYHYMSGTSMAAPYVTGVAALMLSVDPTLTAAGIKKVILDSVDKSDTLSDLCVSGGRLNAFKALTTIKHLYIYEPFSAGKHKGVCPCGSQVVEYHKGSFENLGLIGGHTGTCNICGFTGTESHSWLKVKQTFKCTVCYASSEFIPVAPVLADRVPYNLQNDLENGQTIIIGNTVILRYDGQYYILTES